MIKAAYIQQLRNILIAGVVLSSLSAYAYDLDTHFYGTYSMARFAGIRHEVALKIATAAQWMDESYMSDPLSMILLPDVGIKKRRLLHFPGSKLASKITTETLPSFFDPSSGVKLKMYTETEADHEFATEMFTEGLMQGDLMKTAAGIHTLQDSFSHAGTVAELGHAHFWHHPDRPYVNSDSVEKYFKMSRSVLRAMVAIRSLLPMKGIDTEVRFSEIPNYKLNADRLADIYTNLANVRNAISRKILNEPKFVKFALEHVFSRAQKVNYIGEGYQKYLNNFTQGQDSYEAAASVTKTLPPEMINVEAIMKDTGRPVTLNADYILSMGGIAEFAVKVIRDLLNGIVPRPMSANHQFETEEDGPVWIKELDMRVANMRILIYEMYGKNIYFIPSNTNSRHGYLQEMSRSVEANPTFPKNKGSAEYATYSANEKFMFNQMVFKFLFPKLSEFVKNNTEELVRLSQFIINVQKDNPDIKTFTAKVGNIYTTVRDFTQALNFFSDFRTKFALAREDISQGRLIPNSYNRYYVVPTLLRRQIDQGVFKPLLTNQQLDQLTTNNKP